ncbi:MAG: OmpA family protein [Deltaproteobacteria bacterium]|nr:OmpA family protein [Deltaproteobacteria bacterium]
MNRLLRPVIVAALGTAASGSVAHANVEIGGTAGLHVFSTTNELGVPDVKDAPSERNSALFGLRIGIMFSDMLGVEGEFGVIPSEARVGVFDVWNITYRAHLIAQFGAADPAKKLIPFVLAGGGAMQVVQSKMEDVIAKDTDAELYVGVGAKYRVDNGWGLRADARVLFPPTSAGTGVTVDFEALLSIYKEFGRKTVEKVVEKPSGPHDSDGDGIPDDVDKCPNEPEDKDGFQDDDGCPDPDNDQDGVPDAQDKCPMQAEDKDGFQDDDGCPDPDNDNDGIPDAADKCPNEAEDKDGFQDDDGCPDPDNDQDGVPDAQDKCPDQPETKNGYQDEDGCPDEIPAKVKQFTGAIQGINFKVNSADLLPASNKTLDKAVAVLKEFGDLKMEIQGHTDDQPLKGGGKYADNQALSQARAETVMNYFVKAGIDQSRLSAKGYGDTVPVEDPKGLKGGKLNAARAKNRRVEFKLISNLTAGDSGQAPAPAGGGSGSGK